MVTLKFGLEVTQGHWNWYHSKGKGKGLDTCYSATYMSQTRDQQRCTILEVAADWHEPSQLGYGFLFALHSNYGSILYYFWDKARYWSKNRVFHTILSFDAPARGGGSRRNIATLFGTENQNGVTTRREKVWGYVNRFDRMLKCDGQTDRQTDSQRIIKQQKQTIFAISWFSIKLF